MQNVQFVNERRIRKCNRAKSSVQGVQNKANKRRKDERNPDANCHRGSSYLRTKPHPIKLLTCEKELKENSKEEYQPQKADSNVTE